MDISLENITIPTPAAYDSADPTKQSENFFYVLNQILATAKTAEEPITVNTAPLVQAVKDLMFNGFELSIPILEGPEITFKFTSRSLSLLQV